MFVPHEVPLATLPVSPQTGAPLEHAIAPVRQTLLGVQAVPTAQSPHWPPPHTLLLPHEVPFATFPVSTQTDAPVTQEVAPVRQALAGVQAAPAVQAVHFPLLHTRFVPHTVPLTRLFPVSEHEMVGEQTVCPA